MHPRPSLHPSPPHQEPSFHGDGDTRGAERRRVARSGVDRLPAARRLRPVDDGVLPTGGAPPAAARVIWRSCCALAPWHAHTTCGCGGVRPRRVHCVRRARTTREHVPRKDARRGVPADRARVSSRARTLPGPTRSLHEPNEPNHRRPVGHVSLFCRLRLQAGACAAFESTIAKSQSAPRKSLLLTASPVFSFRSAGTDASRSRARAAQSSRASVQPSAPLRIPPQHPTRSALRSPSRLVRPLRW